MSDKIPLTEQDIKKYLDGCIRHWRQSTADYKIFYVDAFQSVRASLFDELLPPDPIQTDTTDPRQAHIADRRQKRPL